MGSTVDTPETEQPTEYVTFGRTLIDGVPVGEGLMFHRDSPTLKLLTETPYPLISNPQRGEYGAALATAEDTDGEFVRAITITPPGARGPPEHVHPAYAETFEVIEGELVLELLGVPRTVTAGQQATVEAGTPYTFRNESDSDTTFTVESRPAGRLSDVVALLFGLAHEGKLPDSGHPSFLQAMVMADELGDDTVFTSPPPAIQSVMATMVAPIGRRLGYRASYPKYADDRFWEDHVEQPPAA